MSSSFKPIRLPLFFSLATMALASVCHADLVAHYTFDETSGTQAFNSVAANGGHGTIGDNVTLGVPGISGNAVQLADTTTSIVDMGNATGVFDKLNASGQLTISYWLKSEPTANAGNRNVAVFLGNDQSAFDYIDSGIASGPSPISPGSAQGRNRAFGNANIGEIFGPEVRDNEFHHIALTIDTSVALGALYVDGALVSSGTGTPYSAFPIFNNLEVGRLGRSAPVDPFEGVIDDLQIYDTALAGIDIVRLFNNPGLTIVDLGPLVDGDTNGDGAVDILDFNNIRDSLGYSGLTPGVGPDVAGFDGVVNFRDLRLFQQNFPTSAALSAGSHAVPEPASLLLSLFAAAAVATTVRSSRERS